jgi:hypothetical protein
MKFAKKQLKKILLHGKKTLDNLFKNMQSIRVLLLNKAQTLKRGGKYGKEKGSKEKSNQEEGY